ARINDILHPRSNALAGQAHPLAQKHQVALMNMVRDDEMVIDDGVGDTLGLTPPGRDRPCPLATATRGNDFIQGG
ncbi:MAG: hypothetical protein ABF296_03010, partial [Oceanococcaceae bacterium]